MITKFFKFLNENVNDYNLYHFTDVDLLISILKDGYIESNYDKMLGHGISLTRYKDLNWLYNKVRITLNKNEIKNNYKLKPVHWFNMKHFYDYKDDYRKYGITAKPYTQQNIPANQFEERIITDKNIPVKYIKEIKLPDSISKETLKTIKKLTNIPIIF